MTVKELKEILESIPDFLTIYNSGMEIEDVKVVPNYPIGDSANPNCKYETVLVIE